LRKTVFPFLFLVLMLAAVFPAAAQQRSFVNLSFEQPDLGSTACYRLVPDSLVPGWNTSEGPTPGQGNCTVDPGGGTVSRIELWANSFNSTPARSGTQHAELNATSAARQTQRVCLVNGETIQWRFSHRGRGSATVPDVMRFLVTSSPTIEVVEVRTTSTGSAGTGFASHFESIDQGTASFAAGPNGWADYSGTFSYNGPSGIQGLGFEAVSAGSGNITVGNFLDDIQVSLRPFVEWGTATSNATESSSPSTSLPQIRISGQTTAPTVVQVLITGGTATLGTDYTTPTGAANFTVTIPAGNYDPASPTSLFPLGVVITNDFLVENNETIQFAITPVPASYTVASTTTCGSPAIASSTHTVVDDESPSIGLTKTGTYQDTNGNGITDVGDRVIYAFTVRNTGTSTLTNITVADTLPGVSMSGGSIAVMLPGASNSTTFTATYSITQADINDGDVVNSATASGRDTLNRVVTSPVSSVLVPLQRSPNFTVTKVVTQTSISAPGTLNYTITVRNTGNVTLTGVSLVDTLPDGTTVVPTGPQTDTGTSGALDVGETWTYAASFVVNQARYDSGANQVNAVSVTSAQTDTPRTASATTTITRVGDLAITKTNTFASGASDQAADTVTVGSTVTYVIVVTNNGPATAVGPVVRDTVASGLSCPGTNAVTCTGSAAACGGPFTVTSLTGASGATLGTIAPAATVRLSFQCTVQ